MIRDKQLKIVDVHELAVASVSLITKAPSDH